jgi:hypothetical protein
MNLTKRIVRTSIDYKLLPELHPSIIKAVKNVSKVQNRH